MRVIRDEHTGRVLVQVDGKQYAHIHEIADARVGRRVLWAIADLLRFTGGMAANPQAVRSAASQENISESRPHSGPTHAQVPAANPSPQASPSGEGPRPTAPLPTSAQSAPAIGTGQRLPRRQTRITSTSAQTEPPARERYSLVGYFLKGFTPRESKASTPEPRAFIDEIEEILQGYIERRPTPLPCDVHVQAGPDGALQIEIGLNTYGHPDDVPDPEIRALIKQAVTEWENS
jgi:hypothetical protein